MTHRTPNPYQYPPHFHRGICPLPESHTAEKSVEELQSRFNEQMKHSIDMAKFPKIKAPTIELAGGTLVEDKSPYGNAEDTNRDLECDESLSLTPSHSSNIKHKGWTFTSQDPSTVRQHPDEEGDYSSNQEDRRKIVSRTAREESKMNLEEAIQKQISKNDYILIDDFHNLKADYSKLQIRLAELDEENALLKQNFEEKCRELLEASQTCHTQAGRVTELESINLILQKQFDNKLSSIDPELLKSKKEISQLTILVQNQSSKLLEMESLVKFQEEQNQIALKSKVREIQELSTELEKQKSFTVECQKCNDSLQQEIVEFNEHLQEIEEYQKQMKNLTTEKEKLLNTVSSLEQSLNQKEKLLNTLQCQLQKQKTSITSLLGTQGIEDSIEKISYFISMATQYESLTEQIKKSQEEKVDLEFKLQCFREALCKKLEISTNAQLEEILNEIKGKKLCNIHPLQEASGVLRLSMLSPTQNEISILKSQLQKERENYSKELEKILREHKAEFDLMEKERNSRNSVNKSGVDKEIQCDNITAIITNLEKERAILQAECNRLQQLLGQANAEIKKLCTTSKKISSSILSESYRMKEAEDPAEKGNTNEDIKQLCSKILESLGSESSGTPEPEESEIGKILAEAIYASKRRILEMLERSWEVKYVSSKSLEENLVIFKQEIVTSFLNEVVYPEIRNLTNSKLSVARASLLESEYKLELDRINNESVQFSSYSKKIPIQVSEKFKSINQRVQETLLYQLSETLKNLIQEGISQSQAELEEKHSENIRELKLKYEAQLEKQIEEQKVKHNREISEITQNKLEQISQYSSDVERTRKQYEEDLLKSKEEEISIRLQSEMNIQIESKKTQLIKQYNDSKQELIREFDGLKRKLNEEIELKSNQLTKDYHSMIEQNNSFIEETEKKYNDKLVEKQKLMEDVTRLRTKEIEQEFAHRLEKAEYQTRFESQNIVEKKKAEFDHELKEAEKLYRIKVTELQTQHEAQLVRLKQQCEEQQSLLSKQRTKTVKQTQKTKIVEQKEYLQKLEQLMKKSKDIDEKYAISQKELSDAEERHKEEIEKISNKFKEEKKSLISKHRVELRAVKDNCKNEQIKKLAEKDREIKKLMESHTQEIEKLQEEPQLTKSVIDKTVSAQVTAQKKKLEGEFGFKIKKLKQEYDSKIKEIEENSEIRLNDMHVKYDSLIAEMKESHRKELEKIKASYRQKKKKVEEIRKECEENMRNFLRETSLSNADISPEESKIDIIRTPKEVLNKFGIAMLMELDKLLLVVNGSHTPYNYIDSSDLDS